ncbi:hypothetical protein BBP00_00007603, partial [Phytophthora kernoviae]
MGKSRSRSRVQSGVSERSGRSSRAPSLTSSERAYMIRKAKEASVALVDHAHTLDGPVQWHYTGKFRGIQMYRGEGSYDRVGTVGTEFLCGVTTMMGTIEEVAAYFSQQTTDKMQTKKADDVLDCGVLYSLVQNDPQNPFYRVSAKYLLYEGPNEYEPVGALPGQQMDPRRLQNETRYSDILHDHNDVYHEADEDSLDEDEDEDGLEEQSDYSVFAQSRFTEASRDSVATTNRFDADDGASSIYSGTSTSYWQQESSVASSMVDWNQASSVQPADGFIYEPQASQMSSNFFGASNFTADEDYDKQTGHHYNSTAPIPEDEPAAHSNNTNGE